MRLPRLFILALLIVLPAADFAAEFPARYTLSSLETATPPDSQYPSSRDGDIAWWLLHLDGRELVRCSMHPGKPNPPIEPKELRALAVAALQSECDMYIVDSGRPALEFVESDTGAHWPMAIENARGAPRAYLGALDAMAHAAIEWGKRHEVKPNQAVGQRVYRTVAALGQALRKWPGCPEDIELGIRLESEALYQLESLYERNNSLAKLRFCRQYLTEIRQLAARQAAAASESAPGLDVLRHAAEFRKQWLAGLVVSAIAFLGFGATLASKKGPLSMRVGGAAISTVGLVLTIIAYTEWNGRQKLLEFIWQDSNRSHGHGLSG